MNFWLRKYNIRLESLPVSLLSVSIFVVFICLGILSGILLLLPIQDKIKGDVTIFTSGQPLTLNAPSSGFIFLHKKEGDLIKKGDLIASIDVDVNNQQLLALDELILNQLTANELDLSDEIVTRIHELTNYDFRQINNELYNLNDQIRQLKILTDATDPKSMIANLNRSMNLKVKQLENFKALNQSEKDVLQIMKVQLDSDSMLVEVGAISDRDYQETKKRFIDKQSILIENKLREQTLSGEIISDEQEKHSLLQAQQIKLEELKLGIISQIGTIRESYQSYLDEYIIRSQVSGYATLPYHIVNEETVNEGDVIMYLSKTQNTQSSKSEMFVQAQNAGKINVGMVVRVGLSEFDQKEYGIYYTTVKDVSPVQQNGQYKVTLEVELPLHTSYNIDLPARNTYSGKGEILLGKINLLTKISREIYFNKEKYASL